jgi:hypothetical protein
MTMKSLTKPLILMIIAILLLTGCATTQNNASNDTGVAVSATETQPANPDQVAGAPPVGRPPQGGSSGSVDTGTGAYSMTDGEAISEGTYISDGKFVSSKSLLAQSVIDSQITSGGWAVLSTDAGSNFMLNVLDSTLAILPESKGGMSSGDFSCNSQYGSGYGSYLIGNATENFSGTTITGTTYGAFLTGGTATY